MSDDKYYSIAEMEILYQQFIRILLEAKGIDYIPESLEKALINTIIGQIEAPKATRTLENRLK